MADLVTECGGVPVLVCGDEGAPIASTQDALDVIGAAFSRAAVVAVPVGRFDERFFTLHTGLAGEIMQKFANYQMRLAVVGDISAHVAASTALRDLVFESNRGNQVWFVADLDELDTRLG
ncbi:MAG: alpha/beta hydrolase [Dactylosporangium sp.]|nr:alpha/beta hydrolase [Dactylosporangium sp.]